MPDLVSPNARPQAFVSHSEMDKDDFARPLSVRLAALGVRPWLDEWEIEAGDSLVRQLFDEGVAVADAVVLVTSVNSVDRPWVRDELDQATVRRITEGTRLIPVRLDEVDMPAPLRHLAWLRAERTPESAEETAKRIADTLYGRDRRPAVGPPPDYANDTFPVAELSLGDTRVLSEVVREALARNRLNDLDLGAVRERAGAAGIGEAAFTESVRALAGDGHVQVRHGDRDPARLSLTPTGYDAAIAAVVPDVAEARRRVVAALVNTPGARARTADELIAQTDVPALVIDRLLHDLAVRGLLRVARGSGGRYLVHEFSPALARLLD
ncbi:hypothetical protein GCM10010182_52900 [Actinomadura cremea]|nr:hypothetical protein GCM10010182_52900 [Actinomadura cremea]